MELLLYFLTLIHEQLEEILALFLHVLFILVYEDWLHYQLIEPMHVLGAAAIPALAAA